MRIPVRLPSISMKHAEGIHPQKGLESFSPTKFFFLGWQAAHSIGIVTSSARCQKAGMPKYANGASLSL